MDSDDDSVPLEFSPPTAGDSHPPELSLPAPDLHQVTTSHVVQVNGSTEEGKAVPTDGEIAGGNTYTKPTRGSRRKKKREKREGEFTRQRTSSFCRGFPLEGVSMALYDNTACGISIYVGLQSPRK